MKTDIYYLMVIMGVIFGILFLITLFGIIFKGATHHLLSACIFGFFAWRCYEAANDENERTNFL